MEGKVIGVWVGSNQPNLHFAIPVDLFIDDLDEIELKFVQNKYSFVEPKVLVVDPGYGNQIAELQWQLSNLQDTVSAILKDERLTTMYTWFLSVTEVQ